MRHSLRKPSGHMFLTDPDKPGVVESDTVQCCHCGRHWKYVPGSGRKRGFCMNCRALTCGTPACNPCIPWEKKLDLEERGKEITPDAGKLILLH